MDRTLSSTSSSGPVACLSSPVLGFSLCRRMRFCVTFRLVKKPSTRFSTPKMCWLQPRRQLLHVHLLRLVVQRALSLRSLVLAELLTTHSGLWILHAPLPVYPFHLGHQPRMVWRAGDLLCRYVQSNHCNPRSARFYVHSQAARAIYIVGSSFRVLTPQGYVSVNGAWQTTVLA